MILPPFVYDESLEDWFAAGCQYRRSESERLCGAPAVVHRPHKLIVRHVCVDHATPEELERAQALAAAHGDRIPDRVPVTAEPAGGSVWDATGMCWHRCEDGWRFTAKGREGSTVVGPATTFDRISRRWGPLYDVEPTKANLAAHWDTWRQEQHREAARLLALLDKRGEPR